MEELKNCTIHLCNKPIKNKDKYCSMHRARITRNGSSELIPRELRILEKISVSNSGCYEWQGYKNAGGYGRVRYKGKKLLAHRVFWTIFYGSIPKNKLVLHKCDNPSCCNIEHLFLGTHEDNYEDAVKKGRINPVIRAKKRWEKCPSITRHPNKDKE